MTTDATLDGVLEDYRSKMDSTPPEAHDAILDLLLLATIVDGEVQQIEISELISQYSRFPFFRKDHAEQLCGADGFFLRGELMERYHNQESMDEFLGTLGSQLGSTDAKLEALQVVSAILWSDNLQEVEVDFFFTIGMGLGLSRPDVDQILRNSMPGNRGQASD